MNSKYLPAGEYLTPSYLLESKIKCMTPRSAESVEKSPIWFIEVIRRLKLKNEYIKKHGTANSKTAMIKQCPDCNRKKMFPEYQIENSKNPVTVRCQTCQNIFDETENQKRDSARDKTKSQKLEKIKVEREAKFFRDLPDNVKSNCNPIDISKFSDSGYKTKKSTPEMESFGYSILTSYFIEQKIDSVSLISHLELINKLSSAKDSISGVIDYYKKRKILVIIDFNHANDNHFTTAQIRDIILNRQFSKLKTFIIADKNIKVSSIREIQNFKEIK